MRLKELRKIEKKNDEYLLEQIKLIYASTAIASKGHTTGRSTGS